jgi:hypothetical protein
MKTCNEKMTLAFLLLQLITTHFKHSVIDFLVAKDKIFSTACRDSLVVPIYGPCGVENYIVVIIEAMNEDCE